MTSADDTDNEEIHPTKKKRKTPKSTNEIPDNSQTGEYKKRKKPQKKRSPKKETSTKPGKPNERRQETKPSGTHNSTDARSGSSLPRWGGNATFNGFRIFLHNTCPLDNLLLVFYKIVTTRPDILQLLQNLKS